MNKDKHLFRQFLKRNLPAMAPTFDEGIGIASERYFVAKLVDKIMQKHKIKTVLEAPVDGLMGIPGMNSVYFARHGAEVTVSGPSKELLNNANKFWRKLGLLLKVKFVYDPGIKLPFASVSYDLVWNYCVFERFRKGILFDEMKRISKKYILIITQNKYNYGYLIHRWYHQKQKREWDHGYSELMDLFNLKKLVKSQGLKVEASGVIDVPFWFDTFDMHTRGLGKKLVKNEKNWYWSSLQKGDLKNLEKNKYIIFLDLFQKLLFFPVNYLFAHHFYVLASKK